MPLLGARNKIFLNSSIQMSEVLLSEEQPLLNIYLKNNNIKSTNEQNEKRRSESLQFKNQRVNNVFNWKVRFRIWSDDLCLTFLLTGCTHCWFKRSINFVLITNGITFVKRFRLLPHWNYPVVEDSTFLNEKRYWLLNCSLCQ